MIDLLTSFLNFLSQEVPNAAIEPDTRIMDFDLLDFACAAIRFEMEHRIEIPDEPIEDDSKTIREFISRVSQLPTVGDSNLAEFIKRKESLLSIANDWTQDINMLELGKRVLRICPI